FGVQNPIERHRLLGVHDPCECEDEGHPEYVVSAFRRTGSGPAEAGHYKYALHRRSPFSVTRYATTSFSSSAVSLSRYDGIGEVSTNDTSRSVDRESDTSRSLESSNWMVNVS